MASCRKLLVACTLGAAASVAVAGGNAPDEWSDTERALISSLLIDNLGPPPVDASNRYADNVRAAKLGEKIFNDPRFSANGKISCAKCHRADYGFSDELPKATGIGKTDRRSMPVVGMAYQRWFFWDGRKDSLWAQALAPLENPAEHGISRTHCTQLIFKHYRGEYKKTIGPLPDIDPTTFSPLARPAANDKHALRQWNAIPQEQRQQITQVYVNVGKSLAAFVRTLKPSSSSFDRYARALTTKDTKGLGSLTQKQKKGLRLFIAKAGCINCHNGPLFSNGEFHHVGVPDKGKIDPGRAAVIETISRDEFGFFSRWSDADSEKDGAHVRFLNVAPARYRRAFKTPTLRNVAVRPPYMHAGQFATLSKVLAHYRDVSGKGLADEISHKSLTDDELGQLKSFLESLTSLEQPGKKGGFDRDLKSKR